MAKRLTCPKSKQQQQSPLGRKPLEFCWTTTFAFALLFLVLMTVGDQNIAVAASKLSDRTSTRLASPTVLLNNGQSIPLLGLGTWKSEPGQVKDAVRTAIEAGYRHIDCAHVYANEREVGEALAECFEAGICTRDDLFITSKLWNDCHGDETDILAGLQHTLDQLQLDYLDMYLIHWPVPLQKGSDFATGLKFHTVEEKPFSKTWKGMEAAVKAGKTKGIGVSNWSILKLKELLEDHSLQIPPAINQVERHPYMQQNSLADFCRRHNILITCYSPLGSLDRPAAFKGNDEPQILTCETIGDIAHRVNATPAQVVLKWAMQQGTSTIPKSVNPKRILENLQAVQLPDLSDEDMKAISALDAHRRIVKGEFWTAAPGSPWTLETLWDE